MPIRPEKEIDFNFNVNDTRELNITVDYLDDTYF